MIVTEIKTIKNDTNCKQNPVFITWLNTLGGWENWLFDTTYIESVTTSRSKNFEGYITDLENAEGKTSDVQMKAVPSLKVFGLIPNEDINGLKTVLYSLSCKMLLNPLTWQTDGLKWRTVRPQPGSFHILDARETETLVEIVFDLPYINTQRR
jgi:hypothetical protein